MIIVYGDDDKMGAAVGTLFVEKGVENVFVLTGGLAKFIHKFEEYVEGNIPEYEGSVCDSSVSGRSTARSSRSAVSQMSKLSRLPTGRSGRSVR